MPDTFYEGDVTFHRIEVGPAPSSAAAFVPRADVPNRRYESGAEARRASTRTP
jgi:hypothetical protein